MEKERELAKLVNVLKRTARSADTGQWQDAGDETASWCAGQYNRVLMRMKELEPGVTAIFQPLPEDAPMKVTAIACRQLAAYFEDDEQTRGQASWQAYSAAFDPEAFKDFWKKSSRDIQDLGETIRQSVNQWAHNFRPPHYQHPHGCHTESRETHDEQPEAKKDDVD